MTDPRVEKIAAIGFLPDWAARSIKAFEAAGLLVLADNEDSVERIARAISPVYFEPNYGEHARDDARFEARRVLAALRSSPPADSPAAGGAPGDTSTNCAYEPDKAIRPRGAS